MVCLCVASEDEMMRTTWKRSDQALYRSKNAGRNRGTYLEFGDASADGPGVGSSRKMRNTI